MAFLEIETLQGELEKWAMELSEHVIDFKKRRAIKS
jgi:hypothetical protein